MARMPQVIDLSNEMGVTLVDSMGNDESVVHAARVSVVGARAETEQGERKGLLQYLMSNHHASPFEHVTATFMVEVPIFVAREWHRHRTASYNEWSGRYSNLQARFYAPDYDRPLKQVGKPGAYTFDLGTDDEILVLYREMRHSFQTSWNAYEYLLDEGLAKEVARNVLPLAVYTSFYATANLRNWLNFLSLRTSQDALFEIRDAAFKVEEQLHRIAPTCLNLWDELGRCQL